MDIDIILEADVGPQQFAELAVKAENLGVRAIWSSNYHQNYDAFLVMAPAALATSKIKLAALAVSPWEMHPLKMANALLTLNEISNGRAAVALSGGGGVLGACGWKINSQQKEPWPLKDPIMLNRYPERRVAGVREGIEVIKTARSGKLAYSYDGEIFQITRPFVMDWAKATDPLVYGCCSGPMMVRMGGRVADGIQLSDFTVAMMPEAMENLEKGWALRDDKPEDFRIGNFWAWHMKDDIKVAMYEARRELIWRGAIAGRYKDEIRPFCHDETEVELVVDNFMNLLKAYWTRTGVIDNIPDDLSERLVKGMASTGDMSSMEEELERFDQFAKSGLTELSIRLFDDPMDGLNKIGEHVMPRYS
ncbi:MAG: LLM class flavin-dependent oxidoreductase [Chromatiales bacterium]|jgi:alkanesulfonate monooxygenase SsuD/methylene tetrahydromethanopterin reductase-like flavin-dependent oxidoreductase (luciferase family)|nr:LLM class flavin-dependent oxidoreductase [Chromatiales bacterium]